VYAVVHSAFIPVSPSSVLLRKARALTLSFCAATTHSQR
jgi:hypothetical protein